MNRIHSVRLHPRPARCSSVVDSEGTQGRDEGPGTRDALPSADPPHSAIPDASMPREMESSIPCVSDDQPVRPSMRCPLGIAVKLSVISLDW